MTKLRIGTRWFLAASGLTAATYGAYVAAAFLRYGRVARGGAEETDEMLDRFMPAYDVVERHHIRISAPAAVTFAAAAEMDLYQSWPIRAIFCARELAMGGAPAKETTPRPFLELTRAIGWGVWPNARNGRS